MRKQFLVLSFGFLVLCLVVTSAIALQKNAASQTICAELISSSDGSIVTAGTTTVYITGDRVQSEGTGTISHIGRGVWCYEIPQAETNYAHVVFTFENAAAISESPQTYPSDMWAAALPGAFGLGTAGYILGAIPSGVTVTPSALSAGVIQNAVTSSTNAVVTVIRGDTKTLTFNLGTGWPLAGKKVYFIAKKDRAADNSTAIVNREATITDAVNGISTISLASPETDTAGSYYAEVEVRNSDDSNPQTARQFILKIDPDVRQ